MTSDLDAFVEHWLYDIERILKSRQNELRENLPSADKEAAKRAMSEIEKIESWLKPSTESEAAKEKLQRIRAVLEDGSDSPEKRLQAIHDLSRSARKTRGRPRDKTGPYAIRALTLSLATDKSWRQIALEVKGCDDPHPEGLSCEKCKEAVRNAVNRLQEFLRRIGGNPKFPSHKELSRMSKAQLDALLRSQ
jgi:plasmid stabilization system protein ParE